MRGGTADADRRQRLSEIFSGAIEAHRRFAAGEIEAVLATVAALCRALEAGGKVLAFGNGGSAADSQHFAAELVGRFARERRALAAVALSTDTSVLTSIANDYRYDRVFARQIEAIGGPGDVAIGISTSGASANVAAGLEAARARGLTTIALTGQDGGPVAAAADIHIRVPVASRARIQEVHGTILHAICELVEEAV